MIGDKLKKKFFFENSSFEEDAGRAPKRRASSLYFFYVDGRGFGRLSSFFPPFLSVFLMFIYFG